MGGLISAYDLSGDELMLEKGQRIGRMARSCLGYFFWLSQLTSKEFYYDVVQKITDLSDSDQWISSSRLGTLFPTHLNPQSPQSLSGQYTFGVMANSYYKYLIKHQLSQGTNSQYTVRCIHLQSSWKQDLDLALEHADACVWAYESTTTGVGPEQITIVEGDEQTQWQLVIYKVASGSGTFTVPAEPAEEENMSFNNIFGDGPPVGPTAAAPEAEAKKPLTGGKIWPKDHLHLFMHRKATSAAPFCRPDPVTVSSAGPSGPTPAPVAQLSYPSGLNFAQGQPVGPRG
ncbi:hypothetical protein H4Q26_001846 [Puccinia striiformis f. sp. tritici PST-130]|nr:hypothetical protein H4Q26_001846 [Puccinia striiformis f. sp. tritici PST-130]